MLPRFFAPVPLREGALVHLPPDESHHLEQVMRLRVGDDIVVFDGRGTEFRARIEGRDREAIRVRLIEREPSVPEPHVHLTVAQAVLKGERMDEVVRDLTMMGATAIQPLATSRTLPLEKLRASRALERWRRISIASAKQCRRAVLPELAAPVGFEEFVRADAAEHRLILVEPRDGAATAADGDALGRSRPATATIAIGPEGGWSEEELRVAREAGYTPLTLGRRTLRADAVPVAALAVVFYVWGEL